MDTNAERTGQLVSLGIGQAVVLLSQSFALLAYKRALTPLYSSVPASSYISYVSVVSSALGSVVDIPPSVAALVYGSFLAAAPNMVFYVGKCTARHKDPVLGPIVTHAVVLAPILMAGIALFQSLHSRKDSDTVYTRLFRLPLMLFIFPSLEPLWNSLAQLQTIPATEIFIALAVAAFSFWVGHAYVVENQNQKPKVAETPAPNEKGKEKDDVPKKTPAPTPKKTWAQKMPKVPSLLTYFVLVLLTSASYRYSPSIHSHFRTGQLKAPYIHPNGNVTILSSRQSVTGIIVVGETGPGNEPYSRIRYLRASHSLLGGVWTNERIADVDARFSTRDAAGNQLGDSIYTAFILQEAVRLIDSTSRGNDWSGSEALTIGLGTGIATTALKNHGFETTVVEIDPAVYDAARTYFGLPDPGEGRVFLQDARGFVWDRKRRLESGEDLPKFDVVIHDVFSGGGVPGHLFTLEFWNDLKDIMKEDGVAVVNFAGAPGSKSSKAILTTLLHAFGQCGAFYDSMQELSEEQLKEEFLNIVFFCMPVPVTTKRITFRRSREEDYLGSNLRRHIFQHLPRHELAFDVILGRANEGYDPEAKTLLTDSSNPLSEWQDEDALHHWQLMKEVLPDIYWETF